jgi:hypothetical protein
MKEHNVVEKLGRYYWRILEVRDGRAALLLAKNIVGYTFYKFYNKDEIDGTWEQCTLRQYLNGEFYRNFSRLDRARILDANNENPNNQWYGTKGGNATTDKIFLLSIDEVVRYFGDSGDLASRNGWYPESDKKWKIERGYGLYEHNDGKGYIINDKFNSNRMASWDNFNSRWLLRSPGKEGNSLAMIMPDGCVDIEGITVGDDFMVGIRPALWLNLNGKIRLPFAI